MRKKYMDETINPKASARELFPTQSTYDTTSYDTTEKGKATLGAYNTAKEILDKHGDFNFGNQQQLDNIINSILNREKFTYDLNGDALYQQYKDRYTQQAKMAMGDAIGQASAMTGGYGNSYAQSVGQQMYQKEMQGLNDIVPELYQMALDKYNMEGQELNNQYGMLSDAYNREYGQYTDKYGRLIDAVNIARGDYYDGANMHYTEQNNKNTVAGKLFDEAMAISNFERQLERDSIEDLHWEHDYEARVKNNLSESTTGVKGNDGNDNPHEDSSNSETFNGNTYDSAADYMKSYGVPSDRIAGMMTRSEWARRRSSYLSNGQGGAEVKNYSSYAEYLKAYTEYAVENYGL